jgi:multimeric flavodoxin WrbA
MSTKVVAILGSYGKGGITDAAIEAILIGAREKGAETHTVYLAEKKLEFCDCCRKCALSPGPERGRCSLKDDLEPILTEIEGADAVVLSSPVSHGNVTAIFRLFMERLTGYFYWPWGQREPRLRARASSRKAVLVATSGMPGFLIPLLSDAASTLRLTARALGSKPFDTLWIGGCAWRPQQELTPADSERARQIGWKLA